MKLDFSRGAKLIPPTDTDGRPAEGLSCTGREDGEPKVRERCPDADGSEAGMRMRLGAKSEIDGEIF